MSTIPAVVEAHRPGRHQEKPHSSIGLNAQQVISKRYSLKDPKGQPIEEWPDIVRRVVGQVSKVETDHQKRDEFFEAMSDAMLNRLFIPNTPCLVNAGKQNGMLAACFVLPVPDSISGIMEHAKACATVHQQGGGTGMTYELLRPAGAMVSSTRGVASGPVSFMNVVNQTTEVVKQGGVRRGANMAILRVSHPDVLRFIHAKNDQESLKNFNISLTITDAFMDAVEEGGWFQLEFNGSAWNEPIFDPVQQGNYCIYRRRDGSIVTFRDKATFAEADLSNCQREEPPAAGMIYAPDVWNRIVASAHKYAEPGVIFIDEVNRHNHLMNSMGPVYATNPCVTADTIIYTDKGLISIRDLIYKQGNKVNVVTDARFGQESSISSASPVFLTGRKEVFRLQTREGYSLRATANHRIMTPQGWVELQNLKTGDGIHILNRKGGFGSTGSLELGRTLGWIVGDGSLTSKKAILSFWGSEQQLAGMFAEYATRLAAPFTDPTRPAEQYSIEPRQIVEREETRVTSTRLYELALLHGLNPGEGKLKVPETVFSGSEQMQRGFLQALFSADGTVADNREKGASVRLTSVSKELLHSVQQLLLNFGIASRIYLNRHSAGPTILPDGKGGRREYECQARHELAISKRNLELFASEIGFIAGEKQLKLNNHLRGMTRGTSSENFVATVESIEFDGIEDVYDLTEPLTSSFIANGIVVHNCAEQALHSHNACNLGSIDVSKFYEPEHGIRWGLLSDVTHLAVRFLDNVIDACVWPLPEIDDVVKRTRPIGLGIMGFADLCLQLEITYGSHESIELMEKVLGFVRREAWRESCRLGAEKGVFPEYERNREAYNNFLQTTIGIEREMLTPRNYEVTNVAPTGTISLAAETSSGIEPNFSWAYVRQDTLGTRTYVHPLAAQALGIEVDQTNQDSINRAAAYVVEHEQELPPYFISAMKVTAEQHIQVLAAAQRNVDNSVSKTCNGAVDDTIESVDALYRLARQLGCKAVSYYRDGSREGQVLTAMKEGPTVVKKEGPPEPPASLSEGERAPDRMDRPRELSGSTWQIEFEGHNLYVTVNHDGKTIQEIFVTGPISSSVGKLASKMLRGGFHAMEVAKTLNTTTGTHSVWFNERLLTSPEQAIAQCIYIMQARLSENTGAQSKGNPSSARDAHSSVASLPATTSLAGYGSPLCPHCEGQLQRTGACWLCEPCGFSKCG